MERNDRGAGFRGCCKDYRELEKVPLSEHIITQIVFISASIYVYASIDT